MRSKMNVKKTLVELSLILREWERERKRERERERERERTPY